jgi:hypothetical protein
MPIQITVPIATHVPSPSDCWRCPSTPEDDESDLDTSPASDSDYDGWLKNNSIEWDQLPEDLQEQEPNMRWIDVYPHLRDDVRDAMAEDDGEPRSNDNRSSPEVSSGSGSEVEAPAAPAPSQAPQKMIKGLRE